MVWHNGKDKPEVGGQYLVRVRSDGYEPLYMVLRWSDINHRWIGVQSFMRITHWCGITHPSDTKC